MGGYLQFLVNPYQINLSKDTMVSNSMPARQFLIIVGDEMRRTATQMERFIGALENDFIDTVEQIRDLSDEQFKTLGFPIGLVNTIRKKLNEAGGPANANGSQP